MEDIATETTNHPTVPHQRTIQAIRATSNQRTDNRRKTHSLTLRHSLRAYAGSHTEHPQRQDLQKHGLQRHKHHRKLQQKSQKIAAMHALHKQCTRKHTYRPGGRANRSTQTKHYKQETKTGKKYLLS
jgi:hypothetical protein